MIGRGGRPDLAVGPNRADAAGVLYPRAGTLGGCTAHNAMITISPHPADWDRIEALTGDPSWSHRNMRRYFQRVEDCRHRPLLRFLHRFGVNPSRHGFGGWLRTERALPVKAIARDIRLIRTLWRLARQAFVDLAFVERRLRWLLVGGADPNDWRLVRDNATGLRYPPLATADHRRNGTRERLLDVASRHQLVIELDALASKVLFDGTRAVGVEYWKGLSRQLRPGG